jgi:hypothetical protein
MEVIAERATAAYAETLDATTSIQVFGTTTNAILEMLERARPGPACRSRSSRSTSAASRADL